jgi:hypothetical protein
VGLVAVAALLDGVFGSDADRNIAVVAIRQSNKTASKRLRRRHHHSTRA